MNTYYLLVWMGGPMRRRATPLRHGPDQGRCREGSELYPELGQMPNER